MSYSFHLPFCVAAAAALLLTGCRDAVAPAVPTVTQVRFPSVAVPGTSAAAPVQLIGTLYMPDVSRTPVRAIVLLPTSSGIQPHREPYYARRFVEAGMAALIVDSFGARGVTSAVEDQSLVTSYQLEADAFGALLFLRGDERVRGDAIAVMGSSKGGTAALNSVFRIREQWRGTSARFAAHVALTPDCTVPHRNPTTTGADLIMVLAEDDDYTAPEACRQYAAAIAATPGARVTIHEVAGAAHGWERLGPVEWIAHAENFSQCGGIMEDDGRITAPAGTAPITSAEYLNWARTACVVRGAHVGGGTVAGRDAVTAHILALLERAL